MKSLTLLFILIVFNINAQSLKVPEKEHFILNINLDYADPNPSDNKSNIIKDYAINYQIEAGIKSALSNVVGIEALIGYESFPSLVGGYEAITGAFGLRLVYGYEEEWDWYIGGRLSKVTRTGNRLGKTYRVNPGLELKVTRELFKNTYGGFRFNLDKAYDQEILDWDVKNRYGVYLVLGIKLFEL